MLSEDQIVDIWMLFKEYLDKKQIELVAERFVDMLADYGVSDEVLKEVIGNADNNLDNAIYYYLELDEDYNEEYEDD